jgi:hypothetical protein
MLGVGGGDDRAVADDEIVFGHHIFPVKASREAARQSRCGK